MILYVYFFFLGVVLKENHISARAFKGEEPQIGYMKEALKLAKRAAKLGEVPIGCVIVRDGQIVGVLRYNLFWDTVPFCTHLYVEEGHRMRGYGRRLMERWEKDMERQGFDMLMTSTQVDEEAQHFYRRLGYKDSGGFVIDVPGYAQPMELIMVKAI